MDANLWRISLPQIKVGDKIKKKCNERKQSVEQRNHCQEVEEEIRKRFEEYLEHKAYTEAPVRNIALLLPNANNYHCDI